MDMRGYTKLFNSILASTIWREEDKTRIVWITMLAMADRDGLVEGSIPGLADMARVEVEDAERAIECLLSPDKYSRTKEFEGRRIEAVDGGWLILNHAKYRHKMSEDERRQYNTKKKAESRARQKGVSNCQTMSMTVHNSPSKSALSAHSEADSEADSDSEAEGKRKTKHSLYSDEFEEFWKAYPRKTAKVDAWKAWKKAELPPLQELILAVESQSKQADWIKDGGQFIPYPASWLNSRRWEDMIATPPDLYPKNPEGMGGDDYDLAGDIRRLAHEALSAAKERQARIDRGEGPELEEWQQDDK